MKKNTGWKIFLGIFLFVIISYCSLFLTVMLDQSLKNQIEGIIWQPYELVYYIMRHPGTEALLLIVIVVLALTAICLVSMSNDNYKGKVQQITPQIITPVPAGQGQHGTAKWMQKKDFDKYFDTVIIDQKKLMNGTLKLDKAGYVLGMKKIPGNKEKLYIVNDDKHVLVIGDTGIGKSRRKALNTLACLLLGEENIFVIDMKKEIYDYTIDAAKERGYYPIVINFISPYVSDRDNILEPICKYLRAGNVSKAIEQTWSTVNQLVGPPPKNAEKLWNGGESSIMAASIMAVCYDNMNHPEYQNMTNVFYFITEMCQDYRGALPLEFYIQSLPDEHPSKILLSATKLAHFKTRSSFYVSAVMTLRLFTIPAINNMTNCSDYDLDKLITENKKIIMYICLPAKDKTYFPLATMTLRKTTDELDRIADEYGGRLPRRWTFIDDEIGNFAEIDNVSMQTTFYRSKGIRHILFLQSDSQFHDIYGKEKAQIIFDNLSYTDYMHSPNSETNKRISDDLDDYTCLSYSVNSNAPAGSLMARGSKGDTKNLIGRKLLKPNEVARITSPYTLVLSNNDPAIMYAPDISECFFNDFFGMGSPEHNKEIRMRRREEDEKRSRPDNEKMQLWNVWKKWQRHIDILIAEQQKKKEMEV